MSNLFNIHKYSSLIVIIAAVITGHIITSGNLVLVTAFYVGLIATSISLKHPEIGILVFVVILSSIVYNEALPLLRIGIGSLHPTDILLILFLLSILSKKVINQSYHFFQSSLSKPLILFYLISIISVIIGIKQYGLSFTNAMRALRPISYYLLFFVIINNIKSEKQVKFIIKGMFLISIIVALAMILQSILGESVVIMPGRVEVARTFGLNQGSTRILPPGQTLQLVMFITTMTILLTTPLPPNRKNLFFLILILIGISILLTYNRNFWIGIAFASILTISIIKGKLKLKIIGVFSLLIIVFSIFIISLAVSGKTPNFISAIQKRTISLFTPKQVITSSSLSLRKQENYYAFQTIKKHPLFGIGLGNKFRPPFHFEKTKSLVGYIHNSYLWILIKTGVSGFLCFFWFYIRYLINTYNQWKNIQAPYYKAIILSFLLSSISMLLISLVNPIFLQWFSIIIITIMIGLTEVIISLHKNKTIT